MTDVVEGEDGVFRIGRVTEAQDDQVDELYQTKMQNEGVDIAKYREVVRGDVIRTKLEDKIVADVSKPGPQRQVSEIYIPSGDVEVPESAVKVRHILFSPNNTVPDSAASPLPSDDPAWVKAKADADAAYETLKANPELFDETARTESDETGALGRTGTGGKLPGYIAPDDTNYVPEFVEGIHADNPTDGEVLPAVPLELRLACRAGHVPPAPPGPDGEAQERGRWGRGLRATRPRLLGERHQRRRR